MSIPGGGALTIPNTVPAAAADASFFHQVLITDSAAAFGLSQTNGFEIHYGS